ncbi:hypothetical protein TVAG_505880 [Trichomonas vaginalis G3]|uniref:Uncharacterized protein n=1 Tax=Trichomonas vaginalis (strain ATCC PRA-98 / G3) TaxID=412133 RepID=A2GCI4_TRIV3|nr:hypothetical protein TVAG_505880 [Trichomonas vaginalis G3]|eukprot:XP_001298063.1 hypothetical protein [Trichomonas vaginalis G3]
MEDALTSTSVTYTDFASSSISKYADLIDIPITTRVIDSLISLFNYFDIYAPRIPLIYSVVTCIRFFQLIGGAFFSANTDSFLPGTFAYKVMSIITVLFHIVPLQYRLGKAAIILYSINSVLIVFVVHLLVTAYSYKKTSKVPKISCIILSIFNAVGPYTLIPIVAQYSGQTLSAIIQGTVKPNLKDLLALVISFINIFLFNWINIKAYSISLVFRMCSFQSIEGSPQNKLFITTTFVTLVAALTTYFTAIPSAAMIAISILFFIYCTTTVFNCGTFIKQKHQVMVLGGSILGIELCIANLIIIFLKKPWNAAFFLGFGVASVITFVLTEVFIKRKGRRELQILDEIDDTKDISSIRTKNKFKQLLATGFTFSHPVCINFNIFKLAVEEWKLDCDVWSVYAKFISIYPENTGTLCFIAQNIVNLKLNTNLSNIILNSAGYIMRTRETKFTPQLKTRISKLSKNFNKTKTRLRNIWDLVLQGNINELNFAIKRTKESVDDCEREIDHLVMTYPNNRFVARQKLIFLSEVKGDPVNAKQSIDEIIKLQRGIAIKEDTIHELGMMAFPNIPDYCNDSMSTGKTINENESTTNDETVFDDTVNFEAIESISKQIDNHEVPAIHYIYKSAWLCFILLVFLLLVSMIIVYQFYAEAYSKPIYMMQGIAKTRNIITMLTAFAGRFLFQVLDDPKNPGSKLMGPLDYYLTLIWIAMEIIEIQKQS